MYLYVIQWPEHGGLLLPAVPQRVRGCRVLSGGAATWTQTADGINIALPKESRHEIATVIALEVEGQAFDIEPTPISGCSRSLAHRKKATASNTYRGRQQYGPQMALDDDSETRWATDPGTFGAQLDVDLGEPASIGSVFIDERQWNRIQKFQLQYKDGNDWQIVFEGTTVGDAFRKSFEPVQAQHIRLNIQEATEGPTIWEFQLFAAGDE